MILKDHFVFMGYLQILTRLIVADFEQNRYLRKLDQELHKFQLELEADNRGITEVHHKLVLS